MKKVVRQAYPIEVRAMILAFIFLVACFFTRDIFNITIHYSEEQKTAYVGMLLVGSAIVIALLVMWEELLFPVVINKNDSVLKVRNHRRNLLAQTFVYLTIPAIFTIIYLYFNIRNMFHFEIWACICIVIPLVANIFSGIKNYNDFLSLSPTEIQYKNDEKEGKYLIGEIKYISLVKEHDNLPHKLILGVADAEVCIDLDEMELHAYYENVQEFVFKTYRNILR